MEKERKIKKVSDFFYIMLVGFCFAVIILGIAAAVLIFLSLMYGYGLNVWTYAIGASALLIAFTFILARLSGMNNLATEYERDKSLEEAELKKLQSYRIKLNKLLSLNDQKLRSRLAECIAQSPIIVTIDSYKIHLKPQMPEYPDSYLRLMAVVEENKIGKEIGMIKFPEKPEKYAKWEMRLGLVLA